MDNRGAFIPYAKSLGLAEISLSRWVLVSVGTGASQQFRLFWNYGAAKETTKVAAAIVTDQATSATRSRGSVATTSTVLGQTNSPLNGHRHLFGGTLA
jgi:hypothetical protein